MTWIVLGTLVYFLGGIASAQSGAAASAPPGEKSFLARSITISGSIRARWESPQGSDFTVTPADTYVLTRTRLGIAFRPEPWLRFFGEAQDSHALFYQITPSSSIYNPVDFRQGYVEAGQLEGRGVKVRVGRQDLVMGSTRLIASGDWSNTTKTFDIIRGTVALKGFKMDLIAGSPVLIDSDRMDRHKPGEHFYVSYGVFDKLLPGAAIEPYFMAKTQLGVKGKDGKLGDADTLLAGGRLIGKLPAGVEYNFEGVREFGGFGNDNISAWGGAAGLGWTISKAGWKPHAVTDYIFASGDNGRKDGHREGFDYFYGLNQPSNSLTGQFAWRNLEELRSGMDVSPTKKLKVQIDFRDFWLVNLQDGLYNSGGTRTVFNTKASNSHVGEEIDAQAIVTLSKTTTLAVGVGSVFPGAYLEQSGKTSGFLYPFVWLSRKF